MQEVWVGLQQSADGENIYVYTDGVVATENNTKWDTHESHQPSLGECVATTNDNYKKLNRISCASHQKCICEL